MWCRAISRATTDTRLAHTPRLRDDGSALIVVLLIAVLLVAVGMSAALVADVDVMVASRHRDTIGTRYVAEGAADFAVHELALIDDWTPVVSGARVSVMAGRFILPPTAGGTVVDAPAATTVLQQESYGSGRWGANTPRWRLFARGVPGADLPFSGLSQETFVLVWVSDDVAESDDDPETDGNGVVVVRARALGPRRSRADVQVVVARVAAGIVRRVSSRVMR